jgi:hypothetical protein
MFLLSISKLAILVTAYQCQNRETALVGFLNEVARQSPLLCPRLRFHNSVAHACWLGHNHLENTSHQKGLQAFDFISQPPLVQQIRMAPGLLEMFALIDNRHV